MTNGVCEKTVEAKVEQVTKPLKEAMGGVLEAFRPLSEVCERLNQFIEGLEKKETEGKGPTHHRQLNTGGLIRTEVKASEPSEANAADAVVKNWVSPPPLNHRFSEATTPLTDAGKIIGTATVYTRRGVDATALSFTLVDPSNETPSDKLADMALRMAHAHLDRMGVKREPCGRYVGLVEGSRETEVFKSKAIVSLIVKNDG